MISIDQIKKFYPDFMAEKSVFTKYLLKEYIQLLVLDYLSGISYAQKLIFIGGTNIRLVKGIDRFSEDLDFDCKDLSEKEFLNMSDDVIQFLNRNGFNVEARDKNKSKLTAFRRRLYFPELLFYLELSGHKNERFMIKLEAEDQKVSYNPTLKFIKSCGFFFSFPVPPDSILCSMKISAMLARGKGRDFYDVMFLLSQTNPDYSFLA